MEGLKKYLPPRQKHRQPIASELNHNPIGAPIRVPDRSTPRFAYSSGYPCESTSDMPMKDPSTVPIINPYSVPSETTI